MNFWESYYTYIADRFNTDIDGAKKIIKIYIKELKQRIDNSDDERAKQLWLEEFNGVSYPEPDDFLASIFLFGENPFIP